MKLLLTLLLLTCLCIFVQGQPGTLDKSYGNGGWIYNPNSKITANSIAIQPDNKVIVGSAEWSTDQSTYILTRHNTDGSLDNSFGNKGTVTTIFKDYEQGNGWSSIKVQPDGKIVAAGYDFVFNIDNYPPYDADIVLARFNPDGSPDASFGKDGVVITDFGEYETAEALALEPDGKIITTGIYSLRGIGYDSRILTVCYNSDGSLDNSFGTQGYIVYADYGADNANAVAVQDDGKIVIGGDYIINRYFMLLRYNKDGSLDNGFGSNGFVNTKIITDGRPTDESINSLTIDKEGRIVAAGTCLNISMAVARYKPDGTLDSSFNEDGKQVITVGSYAEAKTVLLLKDERILLAGDASANLELVCLQPNGSFDSSFGTNGKTMSDFGSDETVYNSAVLRTDGKIMIVGFYQNADFYSYLLARYNGYDPGKQPLSVRIKRWLLHHGISWQMQPTKDIRYYAVQRSADGIVYKEIVRISNKAQVDNYEDAAITGSSYYRLAAIGWDGSRTYSNTVLIDESAQVKMFPNPVRDNLQLQGLSAGKTNVSIVDLQGNVRSSSVAGSVNYSINTSNLNAGNYLLKIQHNGSVTTQPFVKE